MSPLERRLHATAQSLGMTVEKVRQNSATIYAVTSASGRTFRVSLPMRTSGGKGSRVEKNLVSTLRRYAEERMTS